MKMQGVTRTIILMVSLAQSINAAAASVPDRAACRFLYTQNNQDNTRSLYVASIDSAGIERLKLNRRPYATYPWTDILCLRHNTLFAMNYSGLYSLDLETLQATRLVCDVMPHYERLHCLDHRVYGVSRQTDETQNIVILDFDRFAYRTLCPNPEPCVNPAIVVSPSHGFLAYHTYDPNGFRITVIKTETGELVCQSPPFDFQLPMIASVFFPPPLAWIDENRILFIESCSRGKLLSLILKKRMINQLSVFHTDTGRFEHIATLPGNPMMHFPPTLINRTGSLAPRLVIKTGGLLAGDYRVDLKAHKLAKDTIMGSPYRLHEGRLLFESTELGHTKRHQVKVDPTGTRLVWLQSGNLYYHDDTRPDAMLVAKGCEIRGVTWIDSRASDRDLSGTIPAHAWISLK